MLKDAIDILTQRRIELGGDTESAISFGACENLRPTSRHDTESAVVGDRFPEASHGSSQVSPVGPDVLAHQVPVTVMLDHLRNMPVSASEFSFVVCLQVVSLVEVGLSVASPGPISMPHPQELSVNEIEHDINPDHVRLLATKWLSPNDLAVLVEREGLKYKKGRFSLSEQRSIQSAMETYKTVSLYPCTEYFVSHRLRQRTSKTTSDMQEMLFQRYDRTRDEIFWSELGE